MKCKQSKWLALGLALAVVGCQESEPPLAAKTVTLPPNNFDPGVDAGWKGIVVGDAKLVAELKDKNSGNRGQSFAPRSDPFALMPEERSFEARQSSERYLSTAGGFSFDYEPPTPTDDTVILEPQPYRRLAGVIVGESVLGLIDMGDRPGLEIIRPGQRIPNSEWTVVSIDEDKAVLRRSGNRLPREIIVRLESPPFTPNQGGGAGGPAGAPGPGGGRGGRGAPPSLGAGGGGGAG